MAVYKDTELDIRLRIEAARAAIAYEKPKLSSVGGTGEAARVATTETRKGPLARGQRARESVKAKGRLAPGRMRPNEPH
jgi:hypothetical protein